VTAKAVPVSEEWLHEPKLDDYRLQVEKPATRHSDQRRCSVDAIRIAVLTAY